MDSLTKIALWLIALALWGLLLRPFVLPTPIGAQGGMDVNIVAVGGRPLIRGEPIDVNIEEIGGFSFSGGSLPVTQK